MYKYYPISSTDSGEQNPGWDCMLNHGRPMGPKGVMQHRVPFNWVGFIDFPKESEYHCFLRRFRTVDELGDCHHPPRCSFIPETAKIDINPFSTPKKHTHTD